MWTALSALHSMFAWTCSAVLRAWRKKEGGEGGRMAVPARRAQHARH
jgi:hypothetical protein